MSPAARTMALALAGLATAAPAPAETYAPALIALIDEATAACRAFENGTLDVPGDAAVRLDLTGDGRGWVLDHGRMACSSAASLFCGSGGCLTAFVVGDHVTTRMSQGYGMAQLGDRPVILVDVHGALCGGINPTPCVEALVWDGDRETFSTVAPPPE